VASCIFELAGVRSRVELTADFACVRLHGPAGAYQGCYDQEALEARAKLVREWRSRLRAVYIYFDNDEKGFAVRNALELPMMM
jgi:uncharacterized protein YecE (DUF72 family)